MPEKNEAQAFNKKYKYKHGYELSAIQETEKLENQPVADHHSVSLKVE